MNTIRIFHAVFLINAAFLSASLAATNTFSVLGGSFVDYTINGQQDPALTLVRGFTYTFNLNASGHPFWIKTPPGGTGNGNAYNTGVTGNGTAVGTITFTVPMNAPDLLQYNCQFHSSMTGPIHIVNPPDIQITALSVGNEAVIQSTGSDDLNINILMSTGLTNSVWENATILLNSYSDGTNSTSVELPAGSAAFFQVQQGFF